MAFDFGLSRIGVAVGNCVLGTTTALPVVRAKDGAPQWQALETLMNEWRPDLLVVGEPLNMDDSPSDLSRLAEKFARRLRGRFGVEVVLVDERLTSFEAKQASREQGHKGDFRRQPVDSLAAQLILQTWLAENAQR